MRASQCASVATQLLGVYLEIVLNAKHQLHTSPLVESADKQAWRLFQHGQACSPDKENEATCDMSCSSLFVTVDSLEDPSALV